MKRLITAVVVIAVLCGLVPSAAQAHILESDGQIGGIFHIYPDDSAVSGEPTVYKIYFSDDSGRFDLAHCACQAVLKQGGRVVSTAPLASDDALISENTVTFPTPAVYDLVVTGEPSGSADFQRFTLDYTVRANGSSVPVQAAFPWLLYTGIGLACGLLLLAAYARGYTKDTIKSRNHDNKE